MNPTVTLLIVRIMISVIFFILALGGPYAIYQLRRFIRYYIESYQALIVRVEVLEQRAGIPSIVEPPPPSGMLGLPRIEKKKSG